MAPDRSKQLSGSFPSNTGSHLTNPALEGTTQPSFRETFTAREDSLWSDHPLSVPVRDGLTCVTIATSFFVLLCGIQTFAYLCVAKRRSNSRGRQGHLQTVQLAEEDKKYVFYISKLPLDMLFTPSAAGAALYLIHARDLLTFPFVPQHRGLTLDLLILLSLMMAYTLQSILAYLLIKPPSCAPKIQHVSLIISLALSLTILITQEDVIVGLVCIVTLYPVPIATLHNAVSSASSVHVWTTILLPILSLTCCLVMPAVYVGLALRWQSVILMSNLSVAMFALALVYFGLIYSLKFKNQVLNTCSTCQKQAQTPKQPPKPQQVNENTPLMRPRTQRPRSKDMTLTQEQQQSVRQMMAAMSRQPMWTGVIGNVSQCSTAVQCDK